MSAALTWCADCGEGVTDFCRGKGGACPHGLPPDARAELLVQSAKAMGVTGLEYRRGSDAYYFDCPETGRSEWNPPEDDGQVLRLAVHLNFTVKHSHHECEVFDEDGEGLASVPIFAASAMVSADQATDPRAAARLAVTMAAAAVAKAMP